MPRAPKKCGRLGCDTRVTGRTYCVPHTPSHSNRRSRLPEDWDTRRAEVERRASGRCQARRHAKGCPGTGTECDHIEPGDDHSYTNLQWLSTECHRAKTNAENRARNRARQATPTPDWVFD